MSQSDEILEYLRSGGSLTALDALNKFKCFRLAARILEYKKRDIPIKTKEINLNGKRFSEYSLPVKNTTIPEFVGGQPSSTQGAFKESFFEGNEIILNGRAYYQE